MEELGKLIKMMRTEAGLSAKEVGKQIGMHQITIYNAERGIKRISMEGFCKIAAVCRYNVLLVKPEHTIVASEAKKMVDNEE